MSFDVNMMFDFCLLKIQEFSQKHQGEAFYAFAIDANLLCLNSEEVAADTLEKYQKEWERKLRQFDCWDDLSHQDLRDVEQLLRISEKHAGLNRDDKSACLKLINDERAKRSQKPNPYSSPDRIRELKENTGDWRYQGFAELTAEVGFDFDAYDEHYEMDAHEQRTSEYAQAMEQLLSMLNSFLVFESLKRTKDFYATRVEHDY
ncbi:hypothetical protein EZV61_19340 [Corallincola luteus]|uniref:Uncharacterized protein n=1 Tax=Corallincola luteus TaxID=1775177 RepID=A0ABY2AFA1_9GAMM|nr:hypothetical protein [Corallincola luteus]TCI01065.1 hypothetical protein EZV61_19340 [Corallincola luteus]